MNNDTLLLLSSIGLILSIVPVTLHGIEAFFPLQARWIVNWVLPLFGLKSLKRATALSRAEQIEMLDAAIDSTPVGKKAAGKDYLFLLLFEQRQGAIGFIAIAVGAVFGLALPLAARNPLHLVYGVVAVLMMLANANHAGVPFLGINPRVSTNGKNVGIVFTPFWAVVAALNLLPFLYTLT